jgi:hypothetical protein
VACSWIPSKNGATSDSVNWDDHPEMFPIAIEQEGTLGSGQDASAVRTPVMAIVFGPGVNRTLAYLAVLKVFQQKGIKFQMAAGSELGACWALWYAQQLSLGRMEWLFYQYLRRPLETPFKKSWQKMLRELWGKTWQQGRIEDQRLVLLVPAVHHGEVEYGRRGPLAAAMETNLKLNFGVKRPLGPLKLAAVLRQAGADLIFGLNVLGDGTNLRFQSESRFQKLGQPYQNFAEGHIIGQKDFDLVLDLPVAGPLDNSDDVQALMGTYEQLALKFVQQITEKVTAWQQDRPELDPAENTGTFE